MAAHVFPPSGGTWTHQATLQAGSSQPDTWFGQHVAIWDDTIVVRASSEDSDGSSWADKSAANSGAVHVFFRRGAGWDRGPYLKAANGDAGDGFGSAVASDDGTVVAGTCYEEGDGSDPLDNSLFNAGAAYVFR